MRFKSKKSGGFQVFAVTGVNTVSFGIDSTEAARKGLLGFAVERFDPEEDERFFMPGFKVFPSVIPHPDKDTRVSTFEHPIQSFVWDDFTAKPDREYEYTFHPLKGKPKNLDRSAAPVTIGIRTEALFSERESDVFFNRGVASSQAFVAKFKTWKPDDPPSPKDDEPLQWLSRDLDDALLRFIRNAKKGDALRCCFYEFRYPPALAELKKAIDRGVDVKIIIDAKVNEHTDKKGFHESFPREDNFRKIKDAKIAKKNLILREARTNNIQHNKFMVLLNGKKQVPAEVWTGSTNLSWGGVHGQTNVGHWLRNAKVADRYLAYWTLLSKDPGAHDGDDNTKNKNAAFKKAVEAINAVPSKVEEVAKGVTPVFSPRSGTTILELYFDLVDSALRSACITLAFTVSGKLKQRLVDNTKDSLVSFLLLEKKDVPNKKAKDPFIELTASNNVYQAWGAFLENPVYHFARETNTRSLGLNEHVAYIHSKFLVRDPLGKDPIVVTGSANFSDASTNENDENMIIIRGDRRVADIYFTEFNRLFNHYYFRAVHEELVEKGTDDPKASVFLDEKGEWLAGYAPGKLRRKRLDLYTNMTGFAK